MVVFLIFIIFYYYLYFSGRGIIVLIQKKFSDDLIEQNLFGLKISNFYTYIFLFYLGNLTFIINFFIKISLSTFLLLSVPLLLCNFLNLKLKEVNILSISTLNKISTFFLLSISSYSANLGYDAGLYHLASQLWIKTQKINIGIANFHHRLGFSSIYEYISSNFWFNDNLIFLHFINLIFIVQLFLNLVDYFYKSTNSNLKLVTLLILIYCFLDNFGFNGGKNGFIEIEGVTKFDTPFGIVFAISMFLMFYIFINNSVKKEEIYLLMLMIIFSIQIRPTGLLLLIPFFLMIYMFKNKTKFSLVNNLANKLSGLVLILWMIKNIILSGCGIFPIEILCIDNLKWYQAGYANSITKDIGNSLRAYSLDQNVFDWYIEWSNKFFWNQSTMLNFIISISVLIIFIKLIGKNTQIINKGNFNLILINLLYFIFWIFTAPDFRFSIGFILSFIFLLGLTTKLLDLKLSKKFLNFIFIFLYIPSITFLPRLENYAMFLDSPLEFRNIKVEDQLLPESEYKEKTIGYGVEKVNRNEVCSLRLDCSPYYEPPTKIENIFTYNMYYQHQN